MPHISVKMIEGRSEEQKKQLAKALEEALTKTLGCGAHWVSISIDDFSGSEWQKVFKEDIESNPHLYKKPEYDPKILL